MVVDADVKIVQAFIVLLMLVEAYEEICVVQVPQAIITLLEIFNVLAVMELLLPQLVKILGK
jgi:hypothetical protein